MIKFIFKFFAVCPLRINRFIGASIGFISWVINNKDAKIVRQNILLCFPNLDKSQQNILIKKSLVNIGMSITEAPFIWFNSFENNATFVRNRIGIEYIKNSQPIILLTPHFASFELTARILSMVRDVVFLYKPVKQQNIEKWLFKQRNQNNITMVETGYKGIIKLNKHLKGNGLIGILPDQNPGDNGQIIAPFFGIATKTSTLLVKLAKKHNAKIIMCYAMRVDNGFDLILEPIDIIEDSIKNSVINMNKSIENLVKKYPEHYLWNYKRFKDTHKYEL